MFSLSDVLDLVPSGFAQVVLLKASGVAFAALLWMYLLGDLFATPFCLRSPFWPPAALGTLALLCFGSAELLR